MRSELALIALLLAACDEKPAGPAPERFASVKKGVKAAESSFCEKSYGAGERAFTAPPLRAGEHAKAKGWTWVNLWATWCKPCVEEMGLLNRWAEGFEREGLPVSFELLSIDEPDADAALAEWRKKNLAGPISVVRSTADFSAFLESLGVDKNAAIPIHVLVDPKGSLRCVRVGSIHQENYGAVRALISGG